MDDHLEGKDITSVVGISSIKGDKGEFYAYSVIPFGALCAVPRRHRRVIQMTIFTFICTQSFVQLFFWMPPEKQFLLQGGGDSGLILSTDAKPRLKWTPELHERFVEAVHQLGGSEKATPKTIMRLMGIPGLTLYHLKSHLQKYRLSKNLQAQAHAAHAKSVSGCRTATDKVCEGNGSPASHFALEPQINRSLHFSETLQMQIEVQRRLHEQLEVQRHVQLRIEAQGKYLQSVLEKAQEALAKQGVDVDGLFKARHPPELRLRRQEQHPGDGDGSVDSCLTACEGFHQKKEHDDMLLSIGLCTPHQLGTSTSCCEEYVFLQEPTRVLASPSPADEQCDEFRRDDDGFIGSAAAELDLSINSASTCRPRSGCDKIDLNGSNWK